MKSTYIISIFAALIIMYVLYDSRFINTDSDNTSKSYSCYIGQSKAFNPAFVFVLVFVIVYVIASIYMANPVYCAGPEDANNSQTNDSGYFMGVPNTIAAAWIGGTAAVTASLTTVPAAAKVIGYPIGAIGGLKGLAAANQVSKTNDWSFVKKGLKAGNLPKDYPNPLLDSDSVKQSSVIPFDFDLFVAPAHMMNFLFNYFPSLKTIVLDRLPDECPENYLMTYQTLFTQYNVMVLIGLFSLFISVYLFTMIHILNLIKTHKDYFLKNNFTYLGKLASSRFIDYLIISTTFSLYLGFASLGNCLYFMYLNYIPSEIGNITDIAIQNNQCII